MIQWISHRGESIDAPENTAAAYRLAMERDADGMETDIHFTADKTLVCCHDGWTTRTCGGVALHIEETPLAALRELDASKDKLDFIGEKIPTFAESLKILKPGKKYYVEIKENDPAVIPAMLAEIEKAGIPMDQIVMISFQKDIVRIYKEQYPDYQALWLVWFAQQEDGTFSPSCDELIQILTDIHADGVDAHGNKEHINADFVAKVKAAGFMFAVWTIDRVEDARYFVEAGVDSITSNCAAYMRLKVQG